MPKTPKEIERIILNDGWYLYKKSGSFHKQYKHPNKKGKVTIAFHNKQIPLDTLKSICKQAQIDWRKIK